MNAVSPEYGEVHLPVHDGSQLGPVQLAQLQLLVTVVLLQTEKIFHNVEKYSVVRKTFYRMENYIRIECVKMFANLSNVSLCSSFLVRLRSHLMGVLTGTLF